MVGLAPEGVVVEIDRFWVVCSTGWAERLSGSEEGLVASGVADPADDVFAAKFLQIVGGVAGAVL